MANILEVAEGIQYQTTDEQLAYQIDVSNWATPASVTQVKAYDELDDSDVTTTVFPTNDPSVVDADSDDTDDSILLSLLKSLTENHNYRIEILWVDTGSNVWETLLPVKCIE